MLSFKRLMVLCAPSKRSCNCKQEQQSTVVRAYADLTHWVGVAHPRATMSAASPDLADVWTHLGSQLGLLDEVGSEGFNFFLLLCTPQVDAPLDN
jgi:hypothetical protein